MYETTISYHPLTGNVLLSVVTDESFYYEENGVGAVLTPISEAIVHTPSPGVYF